MAAPIAAALICPVLLSRERYLAALDHLIAQACVSDGQTVLITGEAGIGKSRLVAELQARAAQQHMALLRGRCFEPDRVLPYAPLLDLLRRWMATNDAVDVQAMLGPAADLVR